jgi:hypothetical protein
MLTASNQFICVCSVTELKTVSHFVSLSVEARCSYISTTEVNGLQLIPTENSMVYSSHITYYCAETQFINSQKYSDAVRL